MASQHRLQSNCICCISIYHKSEKSTFLSKSQEKKQTISDIFSDKSTAFIIYHHLNSLLALKRSLKTYFATSPAYHVDSNRTSTALQWHHRTPGELSRNSEINCAISAVPIPLDILTSPNYWQCNNELASVARAISTYIIIQTMLYFLMSKLKAYDSKVLKLYVKQTQSKPAHIYLFFPILP